LWPTPEPATAISSIDVKVYLTLLFNRMQWNKIHGNCGG
jgi:hypothetical protein